MAESHLSSLLKKVTEPEIPAFGFPLIHSGQTICSAEKNGEKGPSPAPEISSEELHRKKLLELERRTQEIEKDAYGKGFEQGEKDGFEYGQKSAQVVRSQLERIVQNLETLPPKIFQDYRDWLARTAVGIARQIVGREIQTSPEIIVDIVGSLLSEAEQHSTLTVYLSPGDMEALEKRTELLDADRTHLIFKPDKRLERGGCRIESATQLLDASISGIFENLEKKILGAASEE